MNLQKQKPINAVWREAVAFAACRHRQQVSGADGTPYIAHPVRVALTVSAEFHFGDPEVATAALLHDVIEKSDATYDELASRFGPRVATMVATLSRDHRLPSAQAEKAYFSALRVADSATRLIKIADIYDHLLHAAWPARRRKEQARHGFELATGSEPSIVLARKCLLEALSQTVPRTRSNGRRVFELFKPNHRERNQYATRR